MLFGKHLSNEKGSGLIIVLMILVQIPILVSISASMMNRKTGMSAKTWDQFVLQESTKSSFLLLEAALRRRLWEPPPDAQCLRSKNFKVEGQFSNGFKFTVTGNYIPAERMILLVADGEKSGYKTQYTKYHKMYDMADYLYLSTSNGTDPSNDVVIGKSTADRNTPSGLIAGSRRIQIASRLRIESSIIPKTDRTFPFALGPPDTYKSYGYNDPKPVEFPVGVGTIIQADKIEIPQGIYYGKAYALDPVFTNTGPGPAQAYPDYPADLLNSTALVIAQPGGNKLGQNIGSVAMITNDYRLALDQVEAIRSGNVTGTATQDNVSKYVYPWALFNQPTFPYFDETAVDSGGYLNSLVSNFFFFHYRNTWGNFNQGNYTCLTTDWTYTATSRYCSASWSFPRGFEAWRTNAGLDNILLAKPEEVKPNNINKIDWDNMDAFQEDAALCGMVVDEATVLPSEVDCDISDYSLLKSYVSNPAGLSCPQVKKLRLQNLETQLNNFDLSTYTSNAVEEGSHLRRVIYAKTPVEIAQESSKGLWTGMTDSTVRDRFSVFIINESKTAFRPFQPDLALPTSSPLVANPGVVRETYFNSDSTDLDPATRLTPLKMAVIMPEEIQILTPGYLYTNVNELKDMFPVVTGVIKPRRHIVTDWIKQENDGFKYGVRNVKIENIALITSEQNQVADNPPATPMRWDDPRGGSRPSGLALRGLWAIMANSHRYTWFNGCMFDEPDGGVNSADRYGAGNNANRACNSPLPFTPFRVGSNPPYAYAFGGNPFPYAPASAGAATSADLIPYVDSNFYSESRCGPPKSEVTGGYMPYVFNLQASNQVSYNAAIRFAGAIVRVGFSDQVPLNKRNLSVREHDYREFVFGNNPEIPFDISDRHIRMPPAPATSCIPGPSQNTGLRINGGYYTFVNLPVADNFRNLAFLKNLELPSVITSGN
ncbi:MAG: hypothetical protein ACOYOK_03305 [Pseudobdellovibrionaceae bacterium]